MTAFFPPVATAAHHNYIGIISGLGRNPRCQRHRTWRACLDRQDADFVNENSILTPHGRTRGDVDADPEDGEASLDTCWDRNVPFRVCPSRSPQPSDFDY